MTNYIEKHIHFVVITVIVFIIFSLFYATYRHENSEKTKLENAIYEQKLKNELLYLKTLEQELKKKAEVEK